LGKLSSPSYPDDPTPNEVTLHLEVGFDGSGSLFCGWIGQTIQIKKQEDQKIFYPDFAISNITRFLAYFGYIYNYASYFGKVDVGIALTGLEGCKGYIEDFYHLRYAHQNTEETYNKVQRFSVELITENRQKAVSELIMPLINTIYQGDFNPFNKVNNRS